MRNKPTGKARKLKVTKIVAVKPLKDVQKASISSLVKTLINRKSETKYVMANIETNIVHNSGIGSADIYRIVPQVAQGTDEWNRLGDSIKPLSLRVRGLVSMDRNTTNTNQVLLVRIIIAQYKAARTQALLAASTSTIASSLLKPNLEGVGTAQAFNGFQNELTYPVNRDMFTVYYDKVHRIAPCYGDTAIEENPSSYVRWYADIDLPATLSYDDSTGNYPTNFMPFYALGYAYADGQGPDVASVKVISNVTSELRFKDF